MADTPLTELCTTDRPDSTARTAASEACWGWAQLPWKVVVAVWGTSTDAPRSASSRERSGKADSKQTRGPIVVSPTSMTTRSAPRRRSSPAASVTDVTQFMTDRRGTYSPNGTSRILS